MKKTSSLVSESLNGKKLFLYISTIATTVVDAVLSIILLISGIVGPILALVALDLLLLFASFNSNFRFKYSLVVPVFCTILSLAIYVLIYISGANVFTTYALLWFVGSHALSIIALVFNVIAGRFSQFKLVSALITTCCVLASACYIALSFLTGFFGQGGIGYRNLKFAYEQKTDSYVIESIVTGNGNKLVIPDTFNGKQVTAIESSVLSEEGLDEIYFNADTEIKFLNPKDFKAFDENCKIFIDKGKIDDLRGELVALARTHSSEPFVSLMNSTVPQNLADGETYITFDYTLESLNHANYQILDTWIGNESDPFKLTDVSEGVDYADQYDIDDEAFLYDTYKRKAMVMNLLIKENEGYTLVSTNALDNEVKDVLVKFENVYQVAVGEDNDALYETSESFKSFNNTGYRYVLGNDHKNLLSTIEARQGFSLSWEYSSGSVTSKKGLTSLSDVIKQSGITVYPKWSLLSPVISSVNTQKDAASYVYGDDVTFTATATAPVDSYNLKYEWQDSEGNWTTESNDNAFTKTNLFPADSGVYKVRVTAYSDTATSLTSQATEAVTISVDKKALGINWTLPNEVYSGTNKALSVSRVDADVINGDNVNVLSDVSTVKNVGSYIFTASLTGEKADLYKIVEPTKSFSVVPYELTNVTWNVPSFTYDGSTHAPTAYAYGIGDESTEIINFNVSGAQVNAGTHTASASIPNGQFKANYTISSSVATKSFNIARREITTFTKSADPVYNGNPQAPVITVQGVTKDGVITLVTTGAKTDAGTNYTLTLSLPAQHAQNYLLVTTSASFNITKAEIAIVWTNKSLTYNGQAQAPTATATGVLGEAIGLNVTGAQTNAGSSYTAQASIASTSFSKNYFLSGSSTSTNFSIAKKSVSAIWSNTNLVYDGQSKAPTAIAQGVSADGTITLTVSGAKIDAGTNYTATASLPSEYQSNYTLTNSSTNFRIAPAVATVTWSNLTFTYDGQSHVPSATATGLTGVPVPVSVTGAKTAAGTYSASLSWTNNNYTMDVSTKTFVINKAELTLTWNSNNTFTANGNPITFEAISISGVIGSENANVVYSYYDAQNNPLSSPPRVAGTYKVIATATNSNYVITTSSSATFTIMPAPTPVQ